MTDTPDDHRRPRTVPVPPFAREMMLRWWRARVPALEQAIADEIAGKNRQAVLDDLARLHTEAEAMVAKMEADAAPSAR
jgi:hypothetical protein